MRTLTKFNFENQTRNLFANPNMEVTNPSSPAAQTSEAKDDIPTNFVNNFDYLQETEKNNEIINKKGNNQQKQQSHLSEQVDIESNNCSIERECFSDTCEDCSITETISDEPDEFIENLENPYVTGYEGIDKKDQEKYYNDTNGKDLDKMNFYFETKLNEHNTKVKLSLSDSRNAAKNYCTPNKRSNKNRMKKGTKFKNDKVNATKTNSFSKRKHKNEKISNQNPNNSLKNRNERKSKVKNGTKIKAFFDKKCSKSNTNIKENITKDIDIDSLKLCYEKSKDNESILDIKDCVYGYNLDKCLKIFKDSYNWIQNEDNKTISKEDEKCCSNSNMNEKDIIERNKKIFGKARNIFELTILHRLYKTEEDIEENLKKLNEMYDYQMKEVEKRLEELKKEKEHNLISESVKNLWMKSNSILEFDHLFKEMNKKERNISLYPERNPDPENLPVAKQDPSSYSEKVFKVSKNGRISQPINLLPVSESKNGDNSDDGLVIYSIIPIINTNNTQPVESGMIVKNN